MTDKVQTAPSAKTVEILRQIEEHQRLKVRMGDSNGKTIVWIERNGARFTLTGQADAVKAAEFQGALVTLLRSYGEEV